MFNLFEDRLQIPAADAFARQQALEAAGKPGQVGERLVVEIHADRLARVFQFFRQVQRADPQSFGARFGFHLLQFTLAGEFALLQRIEVRRKDVGNHSGRLNPPSA